MTKISLGKKSTQETSASDDHSSKTKILSEVISKIESQFGKGAITKLGGVEDSQKLDAISTGSIGLDWAIGIGGYPKGRIVEIFGPESSGKTSLALHCIAESNRRGGICAFIDAEHALDVDYAEKIGVDTESLLVSQPDTGEQALEICDMLVRSSSVDVIVLDSVAALVPKAEIDGDMGDSHMGLQARLMSQALRKLSGVVNKTHTIVIFTNQLREKIGQTFGYGPQETTTGGRALKFYASVRIDIRKQSTLQTADGQIIGHRVKAKVVKNKVAAPFRYAEFDILYGKGISTPGEILDIGEKCGLLEKSGSWYSLAGGRKLGQGREAVRKLLEEDADLLSDLRKQIYDNMFKGI